MREVVGFAAGLLAGTVGAAVATSESGRRLRERLMAEAEPELRSSLEEWDPLLRERLSHAPDACGSRWSWS